MFNIFMQQYYLEERFQTHVPSWFLAEKYYNCDEGWNILKKIFG